MVVSNLGVGRVERGLSLFPARPGAAVVHVVTGLTPALTDATTREANRAAIANAINTVGAAGGGIVFIPAGHYYLQQANISLEQAAININHNNITLRGDGIGRTVLHTRSAYSVVNNKVVRGHGIRVVGTSSSSNPRRNVTLESFELDGGAGHTGDYNWPANTTTGDGWDITHKGIVPCWDDQVDNVTIRDVYVHRYRGEIIYVGGANLNALTLQRVWSCDGNASALNTFADSMAIDDCQFGGPNRFWQEWAQTNNPNAVVLVQNCTFHDQRDDEAGIGISNMSGTQSATWHNNRFIGGWGAFGIYGGIDAAVTMVVDGNYIEGMSVAAVYLSNHVDPTAVNNVGFKNNRMVVCASMLTTYGGAYTSHVFDHNDFSGVGGNTMFYYGGGSWNNVVVSNNIYRNTGSQFTKAGVSTGNPTFTNNIAGGALNDTQAPSVPTNLTAVVGSPLADSHSVWLTWAPSTDNIGVSGYRVYRNGTQIGTARHRWFMDVGLVAGTTYTYAVSAYDATGNASNQSATVQVATP